ncbi:MAG: hypothetical protein NVV68_06930 [Dokdonella sp.]|nr:hypothetical protein [Dokdonella sp.]
MSAPDGIERRRDFGGHFQHDVSASMARALSAIVLLAGVLFLVAGGLECAR